MSLIKVVAFALVAFIAAGVAVTPNPALLGVSYIGPAPDFDCPSNGAHPHETDCEYFYDCWEGDALLGVCTEMQLFDLRYRGCEFAENVDCGDRIRPTGYPGTQTPPMTTTTADPTAPTTTTGSPTGPTTTVPPSNFTCSDDGAFPHEFRCDYYWLCWDNVAELHRCNYDTKYLFDLRFAGCNFAQQTECQDRERPPEYPDYEGGTQSTTPPTPTPTGPTPTGPTTTTTEGPDFECPVDEGFFPHPTDCASYYFCWAGFPFPFTCPDGLYFNPETDECDYPGNVDCDRRAPQRKIK